ncbi:UNVERIFIED_CONTAM: hypothetical protein FKN15_017895 [Acipenser sinensis]
MPFSVCRRYETCLDCVLARDPYCAWDLAVNQCAATADRTADPQNLIQSVGKGDASSCPELVAVMQGRPKLARPVVVFVSTLC